MLCTVNKKIRVGKMKRLEVLVLFLVFFSLLLSLHFKSQAIKVNYLTFNGVLEPKSEYLSEIVPRIDSIFFVETSGSSNLTLKNLCVIESAAKYHPEDQIYILMTSPIVKDPNLAQLQSKYKNIHARKVLSLCL